MSTQAKLLHTILNNFKFASQNVRLTGKDLNIGVLQSVYKGDNVKFYIDNKCRECMELNHAYFENKIENGCIIYGVNTGYGGSADVRHTNITTVQNSLVRHLNAGFGAKINHDITRMVLIVRANSLAQGCSGVSSRLSDALLDLYDNDILPVVPLRGTVSASGDLMTTSYIAAALQGREDLDVLYKGKLMKCPEALDLAGIKPLVFKAKEALAVINASSYAACYGAKVLYESCRAAFLTQVVTALSVEALQGHQESFHPFIGKCLPHSGLSEVSHNLLHFLEGSKLAIAELGANQDDKPSALKQDRYALRSAPQWIGPVLETLTSSVQRVTTEINSACDNPLVDHDNDAIISCANFQGSYITVAMDQTRQALQMCGKLLFAQMSELVNIHLNNGLTPNLAGSDVTQDFGFKGMETAMASYCAELDSLCVPLTAHVLRAEMGNQGVNSMAMVSARRTDEALELLFMMVANILVTQIQAIDLRWMKNKIEQSLFELCTQHDVPYYVSCQLVWWDVVFDPGKIFSVLEAWSPGNQKRISESILEISRRYNMLIENDSFYDDVAKDLGKGTKLFYNFVRETLKVPFYRANFSLDTHLEVAYASMQSPEIDDVIISLLSSLLKKRTGQIDDCDEGENRLSQFI